SAFSLTATTPGFGIESVSPSAGSNAGGTATIVISGLDFAPDAIVSLTQGNTSIPASGRWWVSSETIWATFNLTNAPTGSYDVQGFGDGATATDRGAFTVASGSVGSLDYDLITSTVRPGGISSVTLTYTNTGETDIPAPLFSLAATGGLLQEPGASGFTA